MRLTRTVAPGVHQSGATSSGSAVITALSDTTEIQPGAIATGPGIPFGTLVKSVDSPTQVTLTNNATATATAALSFAVEPVTLAQAKGYLKLDTFTDDDWLIAQFIQAARIHCEVELRQSIMTQTWVLYLDSFPSAGGYYNRAIRQTWPSMGGLPAGIGFYPGMVPNSTGVIDLPNPPLQSVTALQYVDYSGTLQTVDPAIYEVSIGTPARVQPEYSHVWPIARPNIDAVQITFVAGYGSDPSAVPAVVMTAMYMLIGHWYEHRAAAAETGLVEAPLAVRTLLDDLYHGDYQ